MQRYLDSTVRHYRVIYHVNINIIPGITAQTPSATRLPPMGAIRSEIGTVCRFLRRGAAVDNIAYLLSDAPTFQTPEAKWGICVRFPLVYTTPLPS